MQTPDSFHIVLVDPIEELCARWEDEFEGDELVRIHCGYFEDLPDFDCIVSAANSFGLMDGGVDLAIAHFFGKDLIPRVQAAVLAKYRGEQPVGTSMIVETGSAEHPYVAHTPTMRVPMTVADTDYVYNAMFAMLTAVWQHNLSGERPIRTVACPGLGTATGNMDYTEATRQMGLATRHFRSPPSKLTWSYASLRQLAIGRGGDRGGREQR